MKRRAITVLVLTAMFLLLSLMTGSASPEVNPQGWVTLMTEDFEGEFPTGLWFVGPSTKPYLWGKRDCNPYEGDYSMWAGGGGSLGASLACSGTYANNAQTILRYGPFDLSDCTEARLKFAHWTKMANDGDFFGVGFSTNGTNFLVLRFANDTVSICKDWCLESFGMTDWGYMGNLCGESQVWLVFSYSTDSSGVSYGVFVDDVALEVQYDGAVPRVWLPVTFSR